MLQIAKVNGNSLEKVTSYLQKREDTAMFLLSNLARFGPSRLQHPYSGNFNIITSAGEPLGVYCIDNSGTLFISIDVLNKKIMEAIYQNCLLENILPKNVVGSYNIAKKVFLFLKSKNIINKEKLHLKEIIYSLDLYAHPSLPSLSCRLLQYEDYLSWRELRYSYLDELSIPKSFSPEQELVEFKENIHNRLHWGTFYEGNVVSIAFLNAKTSSTAQLGGVYTHPNFRNRGFGKKTVQTVLHDCKVIHKLSKAVIFTDVDNLPARCIYESLQATPVGYLGIFFGAHLP